MQLAFRAAARVGVVTRVANLALFETRKKKVRHVAFRDEADGHDQARNAATIGAKREMLCSVVPDPSNTAHVAAIEIKAIRSSKQPGRDM